MNCILYNVVLWEYFVNSCLTRHLHCQTVIPIVPTYYSVLYCTFCIAQVAVNPVGNVTQTAVHISKTIRYQLISEIYAKVLIVSIHTVYRGATELL